MYLKTFLVNIYCLFAMYMASYFDNIRASDDIYRYDEVHISEKPRFFYLYKRNDMHTIRKITKERELLAFLSFLVTQIITSLVFMASAIFNLDVIIEQYVGYVLPILIIALSFAQLFFHHYVSRATSDIVKRQNRVKEITEKDITNYARNIMRNMYPEGNKSFTVQTKEKKSFWYVNIEYIMLVEGNYLKTLAIKRKFRYSKLYEFEIV